MMIGQRKKPQWGEEFADMAPLQVDAPDMSALAAGGGAKAKPKINWGVIIADALSGLAGQQGHAAEGLMRRRDEQTALERGEEQYRSRRADANDDWRTHQDYEDANRQPTGYQGDLVAQGLVPGSPEFISAMTEYNTNRRDPMQMFSMGDNGFAYAPRSQGATILGGAPTPAPTGPVGGWADEPGGQASPAPATFPPKKRIPLLPYPRNLPRHW